MASTSTSTASSHTAIDTLAWLIDEAFDGDPEQSLLAAVRALRDEDRTALPPGGGRSAADIFEHVGWANLMGGPLAGKHEVLLITAWHRREPNEEPAQIVGTPFPVWGKGAGGMTRPP